MSGFFVKLRGRAGEASTFDDFLILRADRLSLTRFVVELDTPTCMEWDEKKIDETVLALLFLTSFTEQGFVRAWKGHDWDALNRLHEQGFITDPKSKAKSVVLSEEGARRSKELFVKFFGK